MMKNLYCFVFISLILISGCSYVCRYYPDAPGCEVPTATPTPVPTLAPEPTPAPTPTPDNPMWGYVNGSAKILVAGLRTLTPDEDTKAAIFHLYHPETRAWLNIRHRAYNKFQPKGALDSQYCGVDEINWHHMKEGGNGIWNIEWEQRGDTTWVRFTSPLNQCVELNFTGGAAAWREIRPGSGDARIPHGAGADVAVLEISGTIGLAVECAE